MIDAFDIEKSDQEIDFESDTLISQTQTTKGYSCAVWTFIVGKGEKQSWICKIDRSFLSIIVGIIDNVTVEI